MDDPKRRRRWYQFSLRSLMLFMVVCAMVFGWLGKRHAETRREQMVVAEIEKLGGEVRYREMAGPDWLTRHFRRVRNVYFVNTPLNDAGLEHLKELTNLEYIHLNTSHFTDEGVEKLQQALPDCEIWH